MHQWSQHALFRMCSVWCAWLCFGPVHYFCYCCLGDKRAKLFCCRVAQWLDEQGSLWYFHYYCFQPCHAVIPHFLPRPKILCCFCFAPDVLLVMWDSDDWPLPVPQVIVCGSQRLHLILFATLPLSGEWRGSLWAALMNFTWTKGWVSFPPVHMWLSCVIKGFCRSRKRPSDLVRAYEVGLNTL